MATNALVYFDSLASNNSAAWSLGGPGGTAVSSRQFTNSDGSSIANPVLALPAGNYTLTVASLFGQAAGAYTFRLSDLAVATPLTPGSPVSGTLNPRNSTNAYRFSAAAGQSLYFARLSAGGGAFGDSWRLIDPYGNSLFSTSFDNDAGRLTLSAAGNYTGCGGQH